MFVICDLVFAGCGSLSRKHIMVVDVMMEGEMREMARRVVPLTCRSCVYDETLPPLHNRRTGGGNAARELFDLVF